jgi:hypothetical protein
VEANEAKDTVEQQEQPVNLEERIAALEGAVVELQKFAHSEHTISPETLDQIAAHVIQRLNEHLRKVFEPPLQG